MLNKSFDSFKQDILGCIDGINDVNDDENLIELGLNSLKIMKLSATWRKQGATVSFSKLMSKPTINDWYEMLSGNNVSVKPSIEEKNKKDVSECINYDKEFPLTDVQYAYWIGRQEDQILGNISCHAYLEFDGENIDVEKLQKAWNSLINYHPMLHARFTSNGTQMIPAKAAENELIVRDFSDLDEQSVMENLMQVRKDISHRKLDIENGICAGLSLSLLPDNKHRLHFDLDLLVADVQSLNIILRDLARLYCNEQLPENVSKWSFEKYLNNNSKSSKGYEEAREYWQNRVENLPMGPALPLKKKPEDITDFNVTRHLSRIDKNTWKAIKEKASGNQVTPAMVLLTAYATVLERFSDNKKFLINIPLFNRDTEDTVINDVVADFTTLVLLEVNAKDNQGFLKLLNDIRQQFYRDISYKAYSGVELQREITKRKAGEQAIAPVVFACNLGTPLIDERFRSNLGTFTYMVSQTPQVWIDYQTYEDEEGLMVCFDVLEELFEKGFVDSMFKSFVKLLNDLAVNDWDARFDVLPAETVARIQSDTANDALKYENVVNERGYLHRGFFEKANIIPEKTAVIDLENHKPYSYGELAYAALKIGSFITNKNINNEAIAVTIPRGVHQLEAIYGILASLNYYVPVSVGQPFNRRAIIHQKTGIKYVITTKEACAHIQWPEDLKIFVLEDILADDKILVPTPGQYLNSLDQADKYATAYIIMTSGSTGEPKGVEISHYGAINTIRDINSRFNVGEEDVAMAISAIDFDLSVYDTFGILSAGGTLLYVPEEEKKNAFFWLDAVKKYPVTIWNSVPTLLDMLVTAAEEDKVKLPFRVVMLSGDWINMSLPQRVANITDECRFISMGGATEASIWSNICEVTVPLPDNWKSIPYGRPLTNQVYRVVDENGYDTPDYVKGELLIGGAGVAKGYKNDPELTASKFIIEDGIRYYRTGDMGRFWQDGTIEFLGRKDFQVKVGGHRIELGEIEKALEDITGINSAAVILTGKDKNLTAFVTYDDSCNINNSQEDSSINNDDQLLIESDISTRNMDDSVAYFISQILTKTEGNKVLDEYEAVVNLWQQYIKGHNAVEQTDMTISAPVNKMLSDIADNIPDIITGQISDLDFYYKKGHSPFSVFQQLEEYRIIKNGFVQNVIENVVNSGNRINVMELGGDISVTLEILEACADKIDKYLYIAPSKNMIDNARERLKIYDNVKLLYMLPSGEIMGENGIYINRESQLLIAFNTLHQCVNINNRLKSLSGYLNANAKTVFVEMLSDNPIQLLTAAVLERGYTNYSDARNNVNRPVFKHEEWGQILDTNDFVINKTVLYTDTADNSYQYGLFITSYVKRLSILDIDMVKTKLASYVPDYMVPKIIIAMDRLPVTTNGKIDRKALAQYEINDQHEETIGDITQTEAELVDIFVQLFENKEITVLDNYFLLGGDSLSATKLIAILRDKYKISISIAKLFENPKIRDFAKIIDDLRVADNSSNSSGRIIEKREYDRDGRYQPFPLTDVQYAYWIGRSNLYSLGQVGTHCYFELEMATCDYNKLNSSFNSLIRVHDMMRSYILSDGRQCILEKVPEYIIMQMVAEKDKIEHLRDEVRHEMSHQLIDTSKWPLFDIKLTKAEQSDSVRLHISFDNIIFDGFSMFHLLSQWKQVYEGKKIATDIDFSFRDYVLGLEDLKCTEWYEEDKKYWEDRVGNFADAPELPLAVQPESVEVPHFARKQAVIESDKWDKLKKMAQNIGITPSSLLMSAFSETLRLWSKNERFTINLTQFNRVPFNPDINKLVGDFTTLTLLEVDPKGQETFADRAKQLSRQLLSDMEHSYYSGVEVERSLTKASNNHVVNMPIVFTSGIGLDEWNEGSWIGELLYNISQTPQVWLDHQVVERNGSLCLFWDYVEALFDRHMIQEMFETYTNLLGRLAEDKDIWFEKSKSLVQANISKQRAEANKTDKHFNLKTLDAAFASAVGKYGDRNALYYEDVTLTYQELANRALKIADALHIKGAKKSDVVGIFIDKNIDQIESVFGILFNGNCYLPLDVNNPIKRIQRIIQDSDVKFVITNDDNITLLQEVGGITVINIREAIASSNSTFDASTYQSVNKLEDLAYIIYTSGSTGMPKGVAITHGGAANTIADINERYSVSSKDTAIGLSNLHFDLSVYDIFGLLSCGGALALIPQKQLKNPKYWCKVIKNNNVTIWNTVPAFMQMLTASLNTEDVELGLRQVLLSGDWIPVSLPNEIRRIAPKANISGLGGATEASIWSNTYDIPDVIPDDFRSIPYGKPLSNQRYYVLNHSMMDAPDMVPGMLYIAGDGLAKEYYRDPKKTDQRFIWDSNKNQRLYMTGDMGRYLSDGNIEFLGREDAQVKINGYRVELGEIEAAINSAIGEKDIVSVFVKDGENEYTAAFIVDTSDKTWDIQDLKNRLLDLLPEYMVPKVIKIIDKMPLSDNGKVDRKVLQELAREEFAISVTDAKDIAIEEPKSETEEKILDIWKNTLNLDTISVDNHFFELGGNSLQAIHLVNAINEEFSIDIGIDTLFECPTISTLAEYIGA